MRELSVNFTVLLYQTGRSSSFLKCNSLLFLLLMLDAVLICFDHEEKELSFSYKLYIISSLVTVCLLRSYFVVRINNKMFLCF